MHLALRLMTMRTLRIKILVLLIPALFALASCADAAVKRYKVVVVKEYPHDETSYTQGLFFDGGRLYESTGQKGESKFREVDLVSGKPVRNLNFANKYFAEGSVMFGGELFILTWTNKVAFVYDAATLKFKQTFRYPREGWGLTTDGKQLIASDGSNKLYFMDNKYRVQRTVSVKLEGKGVRYLNELEYIDGKIWANVYTTDTIVIINPDDGKVEATIDCRGLYPQSLVDDNTDVLNGIAYNPATKKIYLTGKNWKRLYEIKLEEIKN